MTAANTRRRDDDLGTDATYGNRGGIRTAEVGRVTRDDHERLRQMQAYQRLMEEEMSKARYQKAYMFKVNISGPRSFVAYKDKVYRDEPPFWHVSSFGEQKGPEHCAALECIDGRWRIHEESESLDYYLWHGTDEAILSLFDEHGTPDTWTEVEAI